MFMPQCTFLVELRFLSCSDVAVCTSSYPQTILKNRLSVILFFFLLKEQWTGYATQIIPLKQLFSYCFVCLFVCLLFVSMIQFILIANLAHSVILSFFHFFTFSFFYSVILFIFSFFLSFIISLIFSFSYSCILSFSMFSFFL